MPLTLSELLSRNGDVFSLIDIDKIEIRKSDKKEDYKDPSERFRVDFEYIQGRYTITVINLTDIGITSPHSSDNKFTSYLYHKKILGYKTTKDLNEALRFKKGIIKLLDVIKFE